MDGHEPSFDRERCHTGEEVAAVLAVTDEWLVDTDLQEQVVDVGVVAIGEAHDGDLAREGMRSTDPVDLAVVRRTHHPEQEAVALRRPLGQIVGEEVGALRRAATHDHASHTFDRHGHIVAKSTRRDGIDRSAADAASATGWTDVDRGGRRGVDGCGLGARRARRRRQRPWEVALTGADDSSAASNARFEIVDVPSSSRFELHRDASLVGFATYRELDGVLLVPHVETLVAYRGQGFADRLMGGLVRIVRSDGRRIDPRCSYAAAYMRDHPDDADVLARS